MVPNMIVLLDYWVIPNIIAYQFIKYYYTCYTNYIQGGAPPSYKLVIILVTIDISPINHSEIGLMFTNLANELGHHPVPIIIVYQLYTNYIGFTK